MMIDFEAKLNEVVEEHNALLIREQELEAELRRVHEARVQTFGKVQGIQSILEEHLAAESLAAAENGHGNSDQISLDEMEGAKAE